MDTELVQSIKDELAVLHKAYTVSRLIRNGNYALASAELGVPATTIALAFEFKDVGAYKAMLSELGPDLFSKLLMRVRRLETAVERT